MLRVLLDEDVDVRLRVHFGSNFEVQTVAFLGWKGKSNGELLRAAEESFDVLVTLDTGLSSQQNLSNTISLSSSCDLRRRSSMT
jgi:hypothetical protein